MTLDDDAAYRALLARDARFDGHWFVGVTSTGIYCRPICRVRPPRRENCRFFASAARAEAARFRPCLKCRPEVAPGPGIEWTVMAASHTLALQAGRLLDQQLASGQGSTLAALAAQLGITDRHLRRIFAQVHGVTPLQYLQTRRLLLAKQLLTDSRLPITEVAWASGFRSVRRFNAALAASYRLTPSQLRRHARPAGAAGEADALALRLAYRPPCDWEGLQAFFGARAAAGLEEMQPQGGRRTLRADSLRGADGRPLAHAASWISWRFQPEQHSVSLGFGAALAPHSAVVVGTARRWLDLDANPGPIDAGGGGVPGRPATRLPGHPDAFEVALRTVLEQHLGVAAAVVSTERLLERCGVPVATPWPGLRWAFPDCETLSALTVDEWRRFGLATAQAQTLRRLVADWPAIAQPGQPTQALVEALAARPGINLWSAHWIALRAESCPDLPVPPDATPSATGRGTPVQDPGALAWQPWRSYAAARLSQGHAPAGKLLDERGTPCSTPPP
jgi:AraC family transcriptional regulator of adaptative response / DNA-3-methyladenine glycosylase II